MKKIKHILVLDRKNLHKLRVNIKELRYITEIYCQDKKLKKKRLKVLKQLQTQLGIINDTFIAQDKINKIKAHKAPRRYLMKHLKQQRKACFHKLEKYY